MSGLLALVLELGCNVQQPESDLPQAVTEPAPLVRAPEPTRVPGEYIVVFANGAAGAAIESAAVRVSQAGGENRIKHRYSILPGFAARLDDAALDKLRRDPNVAYVGENQKVSLATVSASPAAGVDRTDQRQGHDGFYDDRGRTGAGVHVYVIDTGINTRHTEFTGRINGGYFSINDGRNISDCHGHGTHVTSTIAGTVYGVAKQATIHPVRVAGCDGNGPLDGVIGGIDFVFQDCQAHGEPCVANMSVVVDGATHPLMNQVVANAVNSGITVVAAAGNEDVDACTRSPAGEPKALTVGAIDDTDLRARFSNWGTCVDIFAPGVGILGASIGSTTAAQTRDGTSMAAPHVAGVAAQYLGVNPHATPAQVEAAIKNAASINCVGDAKGSPNMVAFNDLTQGNYLCSNQPASCRGLCGGPGDGCFCDAECKVFNDCCADYDLICQ